MIQADLKEVKEMGRRLEHIKAVAYPIAVQRTLNDMAFESRQNWIQEQAKSFILRSPSYAKKNTKFKKTKRTLRIKDMASEVGSELDYMKTQELGGVERKSAKAKHGKAIPTTSASGESRTAAIRMKKIRVAKYLKNLKMSKSKFRQNGKNQRQRIAVSLQIAAKEGKDAVYLELGNTKKGIFKMVGVRRVGSRFKLRRINMLYDLCHRAVVIRPNKTLQRAVKRLEFVKMHKKRLQEQLINLGAKGRL